MKCDKVSGFKVLFCNCWHISLSFKFCISDMISVFDWTLNHLKEQTFHFHLLTILAWMNLCFTEKIHWNTRLAASDVFHMFTQSSTFNSIINRCLKNVIHQVDSKNEWLLLSVTFTAKHELVFVLTGENASS